MGKHTPFYDLHVAANAKMVDFAGWDMPLHYGSQLNEHKQVRQHAGLFDVSHMGVVDIQGADAAKYLRQLLANNIDRLTANKALYTCMLNETGGVIDDLIVYKIAEDAFRLVINAGTKEKDLQWMQKALQPYNASLTPRPELVMLAIQGPAIKDKIPAFLPEYAEAILALKPFTFLQAGEMFIARTGYTGEDGYEIIFPEAQAKKVWDALIALQIQPAGLGARDTLRLEAGLNLYGADMDETVTPYESNLAWTVSLEGDRNFIGRPAIEKGKAQGWRQRMVGLVLNGPGIIRNHQKVFLDEQGDKFGIVTSGGYSPTLEKSIALARVPADIGKNCFVEIRNKRILAQVVKPPFVRHGKKCFES